MLNGLDPIIIFQFNKLTPPIAADVAKIPVVSSVFDNISLPPIPIYLSEKLTGLYIDTEDKNIDIETATETNVLGGPPTVNQKALNSTVKITLVALKDSIGLTLISALCDLIVPKVTSKEYSITYLHGAVTVFAGLLHSFSINQVANTNLSTVTLELTKSSGAKPKGPPEVPKADQAVTLQSGVGAAAPTSALTPPLPTPPIPTTPVTAPPVTMPRLG